MVNDGFLFIYLSLSGLVERTQFPLSGPAPILFNVDHAPAIVAIYLGMSSNTVDLMRSNHTTSRGGNYLLPSGEYVFFFSSFFFLGGIGKTY